MTSLNVGLLRHRHARFDACGTRATGFSETTSNFVKQAMCPLFGFRSPHRGNKNSAPDELPPLHSMISSARACGCHTPAQWWNAINIVWLARVAPRVGMSSTQQKNALI
jgi:hypothetical protein